MPKTSRATAKRLCDQALGNLERAQSDILVLAQLFRSYGKEYLEPLGLLVEFLEEGKRAVERFRDEF